MKRRSPAATRSRLNRLSSSSTSCSTGSSPRTSAASPDRHAIGTAATAFLTEESSASKSHFLFKRKTCSARHARARLAAALSPSGNRATPGLLPAWMPGTRATGRRGLEEQPVLVPEQGAGEVARAGLADPGTAAVQPLEDVDRPSRLDPAVVLEHLRDRLEDAKTAPHEFRHLGHERQAVAATGEGQPLGDLVDLPHPCVAAVRRPWRLQARPGRRREPG